MIKGVTFDLDGTLVDSNELHVDSWDRAFRKFGKSFPREALRRQIGKGSDKYLPEFREAAYYSVPFAERRDAVYEMFERFLKEQLLGPPER
jgi:beta-phosphoglucomutase-like phosphatase (HAD superfamily)